MNPHLLEITITAGPTAGQRVRVNQSPAAFGRGADNPLVIDLDTVSRTHGELRFEGDRWVLVNLSQNGTRLNHRSVGRKPRPLRDGDHVVVGNQPIMTVALREAPPEIPPETPPETPPQAPPEAPPKAPLESSPEEAVGARSGGLGVGATPAPPARRSMSPRTKLWLTIAVFWITVFGVAFFLSRGTGGSGPVAGPDIPVLTDVQIAEAVRAPLPIQTASPRTAGQHFEEAESYYGLVSANPQNAFRALFAYKTALSYTIGDDFTDPRSDWGGKPAAELAIAQKRYAELQTRVIADVQRIYKDAHGKLADRRYGDARRGFERVFRLYNDPQNLIYKNALQQRDLARQRRDARR